MKDQDGFPLLLSVTVGLTSGLAILMGTTEMPFLLGALIAIGVASLIGILRPRGILLHALIVAMGTPFVAVVRAMHDISFDISPHNMLPIEVIFAVLLGLFLAAAGVGVGAGLRYLSKRMLTARNVWVPTG
jgi:choline-glycine betaine transporter